MPRPNTSFTLSVDDVALIEDALRAQSRDLAAERLALSEDDPAQLDKVRAATDRLRRVEAVLGRLHEQKVFYRPKTGVYVGG